MDAFVGRDRFGFGRTTWHGMNVGGYLRSLGLRLFRRATLDNELEEEIRSHIAHRADRLEQLGLSRAQAERRARIEFGSGERFKEECREAVGGNFLDTLFQDMRYGLRMLRKSPGFSLVTILTIAVGIGATTAIFSVVDATLLHPLPYPKAEQLVTIQDDLPGVGAQNVGLSQPEYEDLQHSGLFEYVAPAWFDENNLTGSSKPARVRLLIVAPNYFALLGVQPRVGHSFDPRDHSPGLLPEVLISDGLWKSRFGGDPNILDKSVRLDTDLYRIIGVMPSGFRSPGRSPEERNIDVWAASSFYGAPMSDHPPRNRRYLPGAIARLKSGLTISAAQTRLDALVAALEKQFPADYPAQNAWRVRLLPLQQAIVGDVRQPLLMLLGAVGLVLLIACMNVANLMLARASVRTREMAIRQALGAARPRLMQQLFTESLLLSFLGGAAGLGLLFLTKDALVRFIPDTVPRLNEISINWTVLFFTLGTSLLAGIIFGLAPALRAGRVHLSGRLNQEGRTSSASTGPARTRRLLVVTEFALSLVVITASGLLLHSFWDLLNVRLGFDPESVMSVRTRLPEPNDTTTDKYATAGQEAPFLREAIRRCRTLPGTLEVAIGDSGSIPLSRSQRNLSVIADGQFFLTVDGRDAAANQPSVVERCRVTPEYFHLLAIPLLRGRAFTEWDTDQAPPVAIINEAMAQRYWPNENCIGKRFKSARLESPWITVVGVIANARTESLAQEEVPQLYLNLYQTGAKRLAVFLRGSLDPAAISNQVREQIQSIDPALPVFNAEMLKATVSDSLAQRRFSMEMIGLFAVTALLLAAVGIYGLISYGVSERTHEIGIRLALGAQTGSILHMILGQGVRLAVIGSAVGLVGALIVSQLMTSVLYGVKPTDPVVFVAVPSLLFVVALLASYLPARRATKVDPMIALREA